MIGGAGPFDGPCWQRAAHRVVTFTGTTDASFHLRGGIVRGTDGISFKPGSGFTEASAPEHINFEETLALHRVVSLCIAQQPMAMRGLEVLIDIDNKTVYGAFRFSTS